MTLRSAIKPWLWMVLLFSAGLAPARAVSVAAGDVFLTSGATIIHIAAASGNRTLVTGGVAGSGATITSPDFIFCAPNGMVYYAEKSGTQAIVSVSSATGLRTIVSNSTTGGGVNFTDIRGLCWNPSTSKIMVTDLGAGSQGIIFSVDPTSGIRTVVTGNSTTGSGTSIESPKFTACSPTGTIYYLQTTNADANKIMAVDPSNGARSNLSGGVSGSGTTQGSGAYFVGLDSLVWDTATSTLLATDEGQTAANAGVVRINSSNGNRSFFTNSTTPNGGVAFDWPTMLAVASTGTAYYYEKAASGTTNCVIAVNSATGARSILSGGAVGTGTALSSATSMTIGYPLILAPTVTSPTKTGITAAAATLGGNVTSDGGASVTERGVVYAVTTTNNNPLVGGSGVTKTAAGAVGTGVFTVAVSSLAASTGYSYKAYATNSTGTGYSSVDTFTTSAADTTPPQISSVVRLTPSAQTLAAGSSAVTFRVTYTEAVTGVVAANFVIETVSGGTVAGTIGTPTGGPTVWNVPVTITSGTGEFRLKVVN